MTADAGGEAPTLRRRVARWVKSVVPATLFARTLLIFITPVVLAQLIAAWVFFDRHWDNVVMRLARAVAGEIALTIEEIGEAPDAATRERIFARSQRHTGLTFVFLEDEVLTGIVPSRRDILERQMTLVLRTRIPHRFEVANDAASDRVVVRVAIDDGVLQVSVPLGRLYTFTGNLFFAWMVGSAVVLFAVAILFLRNQIRAIKRLAIAADRFGKGQDVPSFRPEGAREVRQAARAFIEMRDRIRRQIQQRTAMLAGVSHDLRTPLTRMKLQLAMLGDGPEIAELQADVDEMRRMIDGYLAFARGESGEAPVPTRLDLLIEEVAAAARREGSAVEVAPMPPLSLPLRPEAIRRCLANLLSNAGRHARHSWIEIRQVAAAEEAQPGARAGRRMAGRMGGRMAGRSGLPRGPRDGTPPEGTAGMVEITIDDDGPGIPEDQYEEAVKPFVRFDPSRNQETGGAGLGLSIALDIARGHGGDLHLARSPRGGLRVTLRLPV